MEQIRQRQHGNPQSDGNPQDADPASSNLDNIRSAGEHFLAAGDNAIQKALGKGNSEAFLAANSQAGGQ